MELPLLFACLRFHAVHVFMPSRVLQQALRVKREVGSELELYSLGRLRCVHRHSATLLTTCEVLCIDEWSAKVRLNPTSFVDKGQTSLVEMV